MTENSIQRLLSSASILRASPTKVALLEEAVREADHLGEEASGYRVRMELVSAATFSGAREKAMIAFSWCLAYFDKQRSIDPSITPDRLLWQYKWIVGRISDFPQISRPQIEQMLDDMQRRYREEGYSLRPVFYYRHWNALEMGDFADAEKYWNDWIVTNRDSLADCEACECSKKSEYYFAVKRDEEGVENVAPILEGHLSCSTVPHGTFADVLMPLVRLGRLEEAAQYQQRGYRMISKNRDYLLEISRHILYLTHLENHNKAVRMFSKHVSWALESPIPADRFHFYLAGAVLFEAIAGKNQRKRKLRFPPNFPLKTEDDSYKPQELSEWLWQETNELTDRFNSRNGNDYFTQRMHDAREVARLA